MRLFISLIISLLLVNVIAAQETPYDRALARIREAQESGAINLDLSSMYLSEVPPEIGNLVNLQRLNLGYNNIRSLPPEIGNLVNLTSLDISGNELTSLPPELGNLRNLRAFNYWGNNLDLPQELEYRSLPVVLDYLDNPEWFYTKNNLKKGAAGVGIVCLAIFTYFVARPKRAKMKLVEINESDSVSG